MNVTGQRLAGKVAVITGGAGGIGAGAAARFVAEGAKVLLVDRDAAALDQVAGPLGDAAATFAGDVTQDTTATAYVAEARRRFGRLDIVLLNAGVEGTIGTIAELPVSVFDQVMAVNVRGVWLGLAAAMPAMEEGGSIVITSSVGAMRGSARLAAYSASKHAVVGLMRSAALEGARRGIRVNCVNPGPVGTRMVDSINEQLGNDRAVREKVIPLGRYARPADIAAMMTFLASDDAEYCTGSTYVVDGGVLSGGS